MMMVGVDVFDFVRLMMILSVKVQLYGGELRIRSTRPFSIFCRCGETSFLCFSYTSCTCRVRIMMMMIMLYIYLAQKKTWEGVFVGRKVCVFFSVDISYFHT